MKQMLVLLMVLLMTTAGAQITDQFGYPEFAHIIMSTFGKYSMSEIKQGEMVRFEKRPDGWYLAVIGYDRTGYAIVKQQYMLWERASGMYHDLPFPLVDNAEDNAGYLDHFLDKSTVWQFKMVPYCGYSGCSMDVINEFGQKDSLNDAYLYGLGRSYAAYASDLLENKTGFESPETSFVLPAGRNAMSSTQLSTYRYYRHKAIECYEKVAKRNPAFETVVGGITLSRDNEYVTAYYDLLTFMNKEEALKELPDGLYDGFYREYPRMMLTACEPNAILFSLGDNDFYSLLYAQAKLGIRPDVLNVNLGLLQSDRYVNSLRHPEGSAEGIKLSFDEREVRQLRKEVIRFNASDESYLLNNLMDFLKDLVKTNASNNNSQYDLFTVPSDKFWLPIGNDTLEVQMLNGVIYLNQLILLDIIVNEKLSRPMYFWFANDEIEYLGLCPYLENQAFIHKLTSRKGDDYDPEVSKYGSVNLEKITQHYMDFNWGSMTNMLPVEEGQAAYYAVNLVYFTSMLMEQERDSTAIMLIDHMLNNIPKEGSLVKDLLFHKFILLYYAMGEIEKANRLAAEIANNVKLGRENYAFGILTPEDRTKAIEMIISSAKQLNQKEIAKLYRGL